MSKIYLLCILLGYFWRTDARAYRNDIWSDCTRDDSPVTLTNLYISPNPAPMPGQILFTIEGFSTRNLSSSRMVVRIKKRTFGFDLPIPCIQNIGSCEYPDLCTMVDDMIAEDWAGFTAEFGTNIRTMLEDSGLSSNVCPQPPRQISIRNYPLPLPTMPNILYWFATGLYKANVRVYDNSNNQELVCFNLEVNVVRGQQPQEPEQEEECSGFFRCWFGGK